MKRYRIAIVDDVEEHRIQIRDLLVSGAKRYGRQLALSPEGLPVIDPFEDPTPLLSLIKHKHGRNFPYDIIIADLYMPDSAHGHAVGDGGAKRIYDAIVEEKLTHKVFLVVTTNRGEGQDQISKMFPGNMTRLPWAWYIPKAESILEGSMDSVFLTNESYVHKLWQVIAACRDRDWRNTFVNLPDEHIIGQEPRLQNAQSEAERFASERLVLLVGEEGTGKEAIARILHGNSGRPGRFVSAPCDGFFRGEVRRLICGASATQGIALQEGFLHKANRGTLYLGKVGDDLDIAEELFQIIGPILSSDERTYRRVGGYNALRFEGAIILGVVNPDALRKRPACRSVLDLAEAFQIALPPLRERRDILGLANHFLEKYAQGGRVSELSIAAQERLCSYRWPQNIAELDSKMRYLARTLSEAVIEPRHLERWPGFREIVSKPSVDAPRLPTRPVSDGARPHGQQLRILLKSAGRCRKAYAVICELEKARQEFANSSLDAISEEFLSHYRLLHRAFKDHGTRLLTMSQTDYQAESIESGLTDIIVAGNTGLIARFTVSQIALNTGPTSLQHSVLDLSKRDQQDEDEHRVRTALCGSNDPAAATDVLKKVVEWVPPAPRSKRRRR